MRRAVRLRSGDDFRRVRREGRSRADSAFVILAAPRPAGPEGESRVGIVTSKRVGDAVTRNRIKRRIRERMRLRYGQVRTGWDIVIIVRAPLVDLDTVALDQALGSLLRRLDLVTEAQCVDLPSA